MQTSHRSMETLPELACTAAAMPASPRVRIKKAKVNINGQIGNANQLLVRDQFGDRVESPSVNPDWPATTLAITSTRRANLTKN